MISTHFFFFFRFPHQRWEGAFNGAFNILDSNGSGKVEFDEVSSSSTVVIWLSCDHFSCISSLALDVLPFPLIDCVLKFMKEFGPTIAGAELPVMLDGEERMTAKIQELVRFGFVLFNPKPHFFLPAQSILLLLLFTIVITSPLAPCTLSQVRKREMRAGACTLTAEQARVKLREKISTMSTSVRKVFAHANSDYQRAGEAEGGLSPDEFKQVY
jgi:hypothetical protein